MIRIGRHVSVPDNYKNKKLGEEIYLILSKYFQTKIKRKFINKSFYPKTAQISIGPNTRLSGKNISQFMKPNIIRKIRKLCTKNNRSLIIHASYAISLSKPTNLNKHVNNVLVRELKGLCLDVELLDDKGVKVEDRQMQEPEREKSAPREEVVSNDK